MPPMCLVHSWYIWELLFCSNLLQYLWFRECYHPVLPSFIFSFGVMESLFKGIFFNVWSWLPRIGQSSLLLISSRGWSMILAIYQNSPRGTGSLFYIGRPHRQHHMSLCVLADQMTLPTHQKPSCPKCAKHYALYALWWVIQAPSPLLFLGASYLPQICNYALHICNYALHECNYALQYATLHLMRNFALQYATLHYVTQLCTTLCKYAL